MINDPNFVVRMANRKDIASITEIYNQAIEERCTAHLTPFSLENRMDWYDSRMNKWATVVAEQKGEVSGFGTLSEYRGGRAALSGVVEVSYFVHRDWRRKGIGKALLTALLESADNEGFHTAIAILLGNNVSSIGLLQKFGFQLWGNMPDTVRFGDHITDHTYYGLTLRSAGQIA